jgi:phospholipase C
MGSSHGVRDTGERVVRDQPTLFDQLDEAGVSWGVYTDGWPRQDSIGWGPVHRGRATVPDFLAELAEGTLPRVTFVDPAGDHDEHPPNDVQPGEAWTRSLVEAAIASPLWPTFAMIFTYDEGGGLFDHAPPPEACPPAPEHPEFDRLGHRVPLIVVSPWARPGHVSHAVHSHTSILRFVQLLHDLPALSARDASSDALLDLFELDCEPDLIAPPAAPAAGAGGCI